MAAHKRTTRPKKTGKARVSAALKKFVRGNPKRVKGAKCSGGRAVLLRNFTGRVIRKRNGQVVIVGRTRKT